MIEQPRTLFPFLMLAMELRDEAERDLALGKLDSAKIKINVIEKIQELCHETNERINKQLDELPSND